MKGAVKILPEVFQVSTAYLTAYFNQIGGGENMGWTYLFI
jgi:hypothetical protein